MNAFFHRAKHWQLFVLLVGMAIILQVFSMLYMNSAVNESMTLNGPPKMSGFFWIYIPMMVLILTIVYGWQWSIGAGLRHLLPKGVRMNFNLFRAFMISPIVILVLYMIYLASIFTQMEDMVGIPDPRQIQSIVTTMMTGFLIFFPLMLFAIFCMFYGFYYCAKTLKSIELGYEAQSGDYIGYFFLIWFNFVGFWILQPIINRITSDDWTPPSPPAGLEPLPNPELPIQPAPEKKEYPRGDLLKTNNHEAFEHDDDFDGLF